MGGWNDSAITKEDATRLQECLMAENNLGIDINVKIDDDKVLIACQEIISKLKKENDSLKQEADCYYQMLCKVSTYLKLWLIPMSHTDTLSNLYSKIHDAFLKYGREKIIPKGRPCDFWDKRKK